MSTITKSITVDQEQMTPPQNTGQGEIDTSLNDLVHELSSFYFENSSSTNFSNSSPLQGSVIQLFPSDSDGASGSNSLLLPHAVSSYSILKQEVERIFQDNPDRSVDEDGVVTMLMIAALHDKYPIIPEDYILKVFTFVKNEIEKFQTRLDVAFINHNDQKWKADWQEAIVEDFSLFLDAYLLDTSNAIKHEIDRNNFYKPMFNRELVITNRSDSEISIINDDFDKIFKDKITKEENAIVSAFHQKEAKKANREYWEDFYKKEERVNKRVNRAVLLIQIVLTIACPVIGCSLGAFCPTIVDPNITTGLSSISALPIAANDAGDQITGKVLDNLYNIGDQTKNFKEKGPDYMAPNDVVKHIHNSRKVRSKKHNQITRKNHLERGYSHHNKVNQSMSSLSQQVKNDLKPILPPNHRQKPIAPRSREKHLTSGAKSTITSIQAVSSQLISP